VKEQIEAVELYKVQNTDYKMQYMQISKPANDSNQNAFDIL